MVVAAVALVFAVAGTAIAGPGAISSKISKSKVKKIAKKQINKAAPGLSVAHADSRGLGRLGDERRRGQRPAIVKVLAKTRSARTTRRSRRSPDSRSRRRAPPPATSSGCSSCRLTPAGTNLTASGNGDAGRCSATAGAAAIRLDSDGTNNNQRGNASFAVSRSDGPVTHGRAQLRQRPGVRVGSGCAVVRGADRVRLRAAFGGDSLSAVEATALRHTPLYDRHVAAGGEAGRVRRLGDAGPVRGCARRAHRGPHRLRRLRRLAHGRDRDFWAAGAGAAAAAALQRRRGRSRSAAPSTRSSAARTAASSTTSSPTGSPTTAT